MLQQNTDAFRHLTQEGVQIHDPEPLADIAAEAQDFFRTMPDADRRFRTANEFYRQLDLTDFSIAERFQQTFAVDAASLPDGLGKILVFYALTAALPGHDPYPATRGLQHVVGDAATATCLALLQTEATADQGIKLLQEVASLLPLP